MNTIRCCISCILPCGALDVIRIVHSNGKVEEISGTIRASEIMKANPKHVLKKPSSSLSNDGDCVIQKIVIVPPDAELQKGKIYFLVPQPNSPLNQQKKKNTSSTKRTTKKKVTTEENSVTMNDKVLISDRYLKEILSENKVLNNQRGRRRGRIGVWRPHLESISEIPIDQ